MSVTNWLINLFSLKWREGMPSKGRSTSRIWSMCFLKCFGNIWWIVFITIHEQQQHCFLTLRRVYCVHSKRKMCWWGHSLVRKKEILGVLMIRFDIQWCCGRTPAWRGARIVQSSLGFLFHEHLFVGRKKKKTDWLKLKSTSTSAKQLTTRLFCSGLTRHTLWKFFNMLVHILVVLTALQRSWIKPVFFNTIIPSPNSTLLAQSTLLFLCPTQHSSHDHFLWWHYQSLWAVALILLFRLQRNAEERLW